MSSNVQLQYVWSQYRNIFWDTEVSALDRPEGDHSTFVVRPASCFIWLLISFDLIYITEACKNKDVYWQHYDGYGIGSF